MIPMISSPFVIDIISTVCTNDRDIDASNADRPPGIEAQGEKTLSHAPVGIIKAAYNTYLSARLTTSAQLHS